MDAKKKTIVFPYSRASVVNEIKSSLKHQGWQTYVETGITTEKSGDKAITQYNSDAKYKFIADGIPAYNVIYDYDYITASIVDTRTGQELIWTEGRFIPSAEFAKRFSQAVIENTK